MKRTICIIFILIFTINFQFLNAMTYYYKETGMRHRYIYELAPESVQNKKDAPKYILRYTFDLKTDSLVLTQAQWNKIEKMVQRYDMLHYKPYIYRPTPKDGENPAVLIRDLEDWTLKINKDGEESFCAGYGNFPDGVCEVRDYLYELAKKDKSKKETKQKANGELFSIVVEADLDELGLVKGSGDYAKGDTVRIVAEPYDGAYFVGWKDGETSPIRDIVVTENKTFVAIFMINHTDEH